MWMLGFAIAAIVAAIALLLRLYVKLSAQEDLPARASPEPLKRPRLSVPLDAASIRGERLRMLAEAAAQDDKPVVVLIPDAPEPALAAPPDGGAVDRPVPVLEVVPARCPKEQCAAPDPHDAGAAAAAGSIRFG